MAGRRFPLVLAQAFPVARARGWSIGRDAASRTKAEEKRRLRAVLKAAAPRLAGVHDVRVAARIVATVERELFGRKLPSKAERLAAKRRYRERNRERVRAAQRAYMRRYRKRNRERDLAAKRAYRERNRERLRAAWRRYYTQNRERVLAACRRYQNAHPDRVRARKRAAARRWRQRHPLYSRQHYARNRERVLEYRRQWAARRRAAERGGVTEL